MVRRSILELIAQELLDLLRTAEPSVHGGRCVVGVVGLWATQCLRLHVQRECIQVACAEYACIEDACAERIHRECIENTYSKNVINLDWQHRPFRLVAYHASTPTHPPPPTTRTGLCEEVVPWPWL